MPAFVDLSGMRFGRLVVSQRALNKGGRTHWRCKCDCGGEKSVPAQCLRGGKTTSCGCRQREVTAERNRSMATHNMCTSPEHNSWNAMISRCYRASAKSHAHYADQGVEVCERWRNSFSAFLSDMGPKPSPRHTLDRIDSTGNYEPSNCRWATWTEQARNRRDNVFITAFGKTRCLAQWAQHTGVKYCTVKWRNKTGWRPGAAVFKGASNPITFKLARNLLNG